MKLSSEFAISRREFLIAAAAVASNIGTEAGMARVDGPPALRSGPMVRWWWPGGDVDDATLQEQMAGFARVGFAGVEIQAFHHGLNPSMVGPSRWARINDFATASFFSHVRVVCSWAKRYGMFVDLTFGSGWPFGGPAITPEIAATELVFSSSAVLGPVHFNGPIPQPQPLPSMRTFFAESMATPTVWPAGWESRIQARARLVAVLAIRGSRARAEPLGSGTWRRPLGRVIEPGILEASTVRDLTSHIDPDGNLDWDVPPGEWQLFVFKQVVSDLRVVAGVGGEPQLVLDHFQRRAFEAHAAYIGDAAALALRPFIGTQWRAIFCDSLELEANLFWSDDFLAEFRIRRGYDLTPFLPVLKVPGFLDGNEGGAAALYEMGARSEAIRSDYRIVTADLIRERFYEPFIQWAHQHRLKARIQSHGAPADVERIYGLADIPETETLYDDGSPDFLRLAGASADVYGRSVVGAEAFAHIGDPYAVTPQELKREVDRLILAGVNELVFHGSPYRYAIPNRAGFSQWFPFLPPTLFTTFFDPSNPFWRYLPQLNAYIARLQDLSRSGRTLTQLAVYRCELSTAEHSQVLRTSGLDDALVESGYTYSQVNADALARARVASAELRLDSGAAFSALIVARARLLPDVLAARLKTWCEAGLPVFFLGTMPQMSDGYAGGDAADKFVQQCMADALGPGSAGQFCPTVAGLVQALRSTITPRVRWASISPLRYLEKRSSAHRTVFFLANGRDSASDLVFEIAQGPPPACWDPWNNRPTQRFCCSREGGAWRVEITLGPNESTLLTFDSFAPPAIARRAPRPAARSTVSIAGPWTVRVEGESPKGTRVRKIIRLRSLVDLTQEPGMRLFSGRMSYTVEFNLGNVLPSKRAILDLGTVRDVAELAVNSKAAGSALFASFRFDITTWVHTGRNSLQIAVINSLANAMAPSLLGKGEAANVRPAGLLGPVNLHFENDA